jgi:hypothetical protein
MRKTPTLRTLTHLNLRGVFYKRSAIVHLATMDNRDPLKRQRAMEVCLQ